MQRRMRALVWTLLRRDRAHCPDGDVKGSRYSPPGRRPCGAVWGASGRWLGAVNAACAGNLGAGRSRMRIRWCPENVNEDAYRRYLPRRRCSSRRRSDGPRAGKDSRVLRRRQRSTGRRYVRPRRLCRGYCGLCLNQQVFDNL